MLRPLISIREEESLQVLKAVKKHGFSVCHLADAAVALSVIDADPVPSDRAADLHVTVDPSL